MKIFVAQIKSIAGDISGNFARIQVAYKQALDAKCDICLLPELVTSGYLAEDLFLSPDFIAEIARVNAELVLATKECALILPTVVKPSLRTLHHDVIASVAKQSQKVCDDITPDLLRLPRSQVVARNDGNVVSPEIATPSQVARNDALYNGVIVAQNSKIIGQTHKAFLPNYGVFDEKRYFTPGKSQVIVINGHKIGIPICEDIWYPEVCTDLKAQGAQAFLVPNASPYEIGKLALRLEQITRRYNETKLPFIFCNQAHAQDGIIFDGNSFCYDGELSMICGGFEEDVSIVSWRVVFEERIDTSLRKTRHSGIRQASALARTERALYPESQEEKRALLLSPEIPDSKSHKYALIERMFDITSGMTTSLLKPPRNDEPEQIYQAITFGLKSYVRDNGFTKVILGISGGIDSSLVATICCDALGSENVTGYMMPTSITSEMSKNDARELAELLNIRLETIAIDGILETYIGAMDADKSAKEEDLMYQNLQARIRGTLLMAQSNKNNSLLITTGNKSEYATGYATLYGDMNGAFNPIKDLYKTQIFALAHYRNSTGEVIPENIITKAPSAELATNQKDSDSLPEYELLDQILYDYIEGNLPRLELYKKFEPAIVDKVIKLVRRAEFKRKQSAPGVKVSKRNFEKDRRFPITNGFG